MALFCGPYQKMVHIPTIGVPTVVGTQKSMTMVGWYRREEAGDHVAEAS